MKYYYNFFFVFYYLFYKKKIIIGIEFIILKNNQNIIGKNLVINLEVIFEWCLVLLVFYNMFYIFIL